MEAGSKTDGQPVSWGTTAHDHELYMILADAAAQTEDANGLRQYGPLLEKLARRDGHILYLAIAQRAAGVAHRLAGEHAQSRARLKAAVGLLENLGARWQLGRTWTELGLLERAASKSRAADEYFSKALAAFEALGASAEAKRIRGLVSA